MFQDFAQVQQYLFEALPMYQRIGDAALKPNLNNTLKLCEALGNPQTKFKSIHIAGTNGKGSSSHALAAVLQAANYRVGLYTSPHLKHFSERIRINGQPIEEQEVVAFVNKHFELLESIKPSFFEMTVALAFWYFEINQVDVAVIEVGLGGRLDSTNVIVPEVCLITNISYDHMNLLGPTLPHIASEKAGIIKPKVPVVISERQEEVMHVFKEKANSAEAQITFASDHWKIEDLGIFDNNREIIVRNGVEEIRISLSLPGAYQLKNLPGILQTLAILSQKGRETDHLDWIKGLGNVQALTGLKGRWQILNKNPYIVADTAHNEGGVAETMAQFCQLPYNVKHIIWGMVNDKDHSKVLALLPKDAHYYFTRPSVERGLPKETLQRLAQEFGLKGHVYPHVNLALQAAINVANADDAIYIGGSTFVVADLNSL